MIGELRGERLGARMSGGEVLQVGQRDLFLAAVLAGQADHDLGGAEALERQQALVDVADLLDGQRAERDRAPLPADR